MCGPFFSDKTALFQEEGVGIRRVSIARDSYCEGSIGDWRFTQCPPDPPKPEGLSYKTVSCFASSGDSIKVTWEPAAVVQGGSLPSGYRVTMNAGREMVVATAGATDHSVTFTTNAAGIFDSTRVVTGATYAVSVETLYDNNRTVSKTAICLTPQNGLPCIPPPIPTPGGDGHSAGTSTVIMRLPTDIEELAVCGCKSSEYHTQNVPGYPPRFWDCKPCVAGTKCVGGTAATVRTVPGWFISGNHSAGLTTLGKNGSQYAIGLPKLWPCPGGASACPGGKLIVPFLSRDTSSTRSSSSNNSNGSMGPCGNLMGNSSVQGGIECVPSTFSSERDREQG